MNLDLKNDIFVLFKLDFIFMVYEIFIWTIDGLNIDHSLSGENTANLKYVYYYSKSLHQHKFNTQITSNIHFILQILTLNKI